MLTRSAFLRGSLAGAAGLALFPGLARAASGEGGVVDGRVLVNTAFGPMWLTKAGGKVVGVVPLAQDCSPNKLLEAMPDRLYNRARVQAPMVRADFLRHREKSDRSQRGTHDFVEVSWDDAAKLVTDEIRRVKETYGNASLHKGKSSWGSNHAHLHRTDPMLQRFFNGYGGASTYFGSYSSEAISQILPTVAWGNISSASDWPVIRANAKLIVIWGANPLVTSRVLSARYNTKAWLDLKGTPVETISIDPIRNETARELGSRWVPVRPNTDVALALGMMHTLLSEKLYDAKFIADYTAGFADFAKYLTGEADQTAKTPAWAEGITGVPAATIQELARKMAASRTTIVSGWSIQRQHHGEQGPWALVVLAAMLGQLGLPGGGLSFGLHYADGGMPAPAMPVVSGISAGPDLVNRTIPIATLSDAWMNPGKTIEYKGRTITYPDIRLVYIAGGNQFTHHQDTNRLIKAFRTPETVIVQEPWWTPTARFADIVLPAASDLERDDVGQVLNMILAAHAAVVPLYKSRLDYDILTEFADRLGFRQKFTEGRDVLGWVRFFYETARGQSKVVAMPDFDTFWNGEGIVEFPMGKGTNVDLADFRADPLLNPLGTATGRIEIVSSSVGKLNYADCPAHPTWLEPVEWRGSAAAEKYPLQLLSAHAMYRLHSQMDNTVAHDWYKVGGREPVLINPVDAAARGIASGDVVRLFNDRGQTLAGAQVTADIAAGAICLREGSWYDPATPGVLGALDKQGSVNTLTLDTPLSSRYAQATIAETALAQVEKYSQAAPAVTAYDQPG